MGATPSMFYSGAVEAAAGAVVNGVLSSFASTYEMQEGLDVTLYSLQQEVIKIQCAVNLARGRRITDQKLLEWLASLIDAAYRGNYYHRTWKYRSSLHWLIESEGTSGLHTSTYHPDHKRRRTIKSLVIGNDKLRELCDALRMLKCIDTCAFTLMVNAHPERPPKTYLYMDRNRLLYRDKERMQVMEFLFQPSTAGANNVDILPIVGPSGVGKTSLALHCFSDPKVQNHFSLKIYISPTRIAYDEEDNGFPWIFVRILKQCYGINITNYDEKTLIVMLKQHFSSERFLLLLDTVGTMDSMVWKTLWDCIRCGKQGSKVLFISGFPCDEYKKIVSSTIEAPIMLYGFSEDDYILFFKEHAFGSADPEDYPELAKIGREIAKKMNGSIWGAKLLGELLRDNLNAPFWSKLLQDGFTNSEFQMDKKNLLSVSNIICQFLPKHLKVDYIIRSWSEWKMQSLSHELKSFRELMVLGPNYCSPNIKEGKNYGVQFLVAEELNLYEWTVVMAICGPTCSDNKILLGDSVWVYFDK